KSASASVFYANYALFKAPNSIRRSVLPTLHIYYNDTTRPIIIEGEHRSAPYATYDTLYVRRFFHS
ncbi:hypothetical protein PHLCEN_2v10164, partial [Hermanssonia centrifuga]